MPRYRFKLTGWLDLDVSDDLEARRRGQLIDRAIRDTIGKDLDVDSVTLIRHGDREGHNLLPKRK